MKLLLQRKWKTPSSTCGELYIDGKFQCFTLERPNKESHNALPPFCIPTGTYPVRMRWSNHFQRNVPGIFDVPGYSDIEIHVGNYPKDVKGCVAVGSSHDTDYVGMSRVAFELLVRQIDGAKGATITIEEEV